MKHRILTEKLRAVRLGDGAEAGLCMTALPWPREGFQGLRMGGKPTGILPLGSWPGTDYPRRLLLFRDQDGQAPEELNFEFTTSASTVDSKPIAEMELFEKCESEILAWERHCLRIRGNGRSVGMALGLRTGGVVHWWEACGLTLVDDSPHFTTVEMAGSIPRRMMSEAEFVQQQGYHSTYLHHHNWISGRLYARLHANGVCEIFAHHINNKFVDDGQDLEDVVPVIGFAIDGDDAGVAQLIGPWDGQRDEITVGGVRMDVREVARLATPEQPGHMDQAGRFLVWQPYAGVDVYGGVCPEARTGDPFIFHAEDRNFPRGMARTLRFSLSLSDRSPRVARYLAPAWWYGLCEEFLPEALLPVSNPWDSVLTEARDWILEHRVRGGFEDGSVPRHISMTKQAKGRLRNEPGWEGEIPYAQFLSAWRTGSAAEYDAAMRSAYHFTDVAIDHAVKLVRMHGYAPPAFAQPMNRVQGTIAAYLETGDPYLLEAAQAVTCNAHWQNKNSWPRMAVGRDACYVRSAVLLYRYTGDDFFRKMAHEGAMMVVLSQRPNGSFGDQGGGAGMHQWSGFISKPWMGLLATSGVLDYLELFPDDAPLRDAVRRFADWLMRERWNFEGKLVWGYQHDYHGERRYFDPTSGEFVQLPSSKPWHHASFARLLAYCTWAFDDPAYLEAWAESFDCYVSDKGDHGYSAALQFIPWLQAKLWNATVTADGIQTSPYSIGSQMRQSAIILGPDGPVPVCHDWISDDDGSSVGVASGSPGPELMIG